MKRLYIFQILGLLLLQLILERVDIGLQVDVPVVFGARMFQFGVRAQSVIYNLARRVSYATPRVSLTKSTPPPHYCPLL